MTTVENRDALARTAAHETALDCVLAGVEAARPERVLRDALELSGGQLRIEGAVYDLDAYDEVAVLGCGKAAGQVAAVLDDLFGDALDGGVVVTDDPVDAGRVDVVEGDHPVPSERGVEGARRVREAAAAAGQGTLVLAVVTGGGSALLPAPAGDLSLADLRATTEALLDAGASVDEINAVRKHCSAVKGGRLARTAAPATVATLAFSDVVGDDPGVVASGPTVPDPTTYDDARAVLARYDLDVPAAVRDHLAAGAAGDRPETPGPDADLSHVRYHLLADAWTAIEAAREAAEERGYGTLVLSSRVRGEAREQGLAHAAVAEEVAATGNPVDPPAVVLSGGETTVTVTGDGDGGPNQEFALRAAMDLPPEAVLCAVDTDGRDGASDAAGALVDGETVGDGEAPAARDALAANDAGSFLGARDALVVTGRTGTNVNDLRALVVR
ncbi:MAG: glycerate kinase [Haloarculaceae archaeon]